MSKDLSLDQLGTIGELLVNLYGAYRHTMSQSERTSVIKVVNFVDERTKKVKEDIVENLTKSETKEIRENSLSRR